MYVSGTHLLRSLVTWLDRIFDRVYGSKHNPLYRSGTLAVTFLTIAVATGTYLLFWYKLSSPYESMLTIEGSRYFARWVRDLHRYTSDLSVVTVVFHVLRMLSEGKSWGPRFLSWITGVFLTLLIFIVGWTGFVLVWDQHAHALVSSGAEMINRIPLFSGAIMRSISGATQIGTSFFFMNLFLHMSLPLGMIILLWLHTSKLRQAAWFPDRAYLVKVLLTLIALSTLGLAPLDAPADPLLLSYKIHLNLFMAFVIPMVEWLTPAGSFAVMAVFFFAVLFVPSYWRPRAGEGPKISVHDPRSCTGCGQCASDCPFDAISMVPRTEGTGSETIAFVDDAACVGCGICTASCSQMAIGPEDKSSRLQMQKIKELKARHARGATLVIHCQRNTLGEAYLNRSQTSLASYPIDCTGNLHVASAAYALDHFGDIQIIGCSPKACINRLGQDLLEDRFVGQRPPEAPARMKFEKVRIFSGSLPDLDRMRQTFNTSGSATKSPWPLRIKSAVATIIAMAAIAGLSAFPYERQVAHSVMRVAIRLPGQVSEVCRDRTAEELAKLPLHMRTPRECERVALDYALSIEVDGQSVLKSTLSARGARGDKPLLFEDDLVIAPGSHKVSVRLNPAQQAEGAVVAADDFSEDFIAGRAWLVSYNANTKVLFHSRSAVK